MQYFADDFSAMTAGNLSLTAGLIAAGYSELENSGIPANVAIVAQPSLPAGLQNDLRFPAASTKQVLRFTLSASDIESRLLWSGFPAGVQTVSVSWWEYRTAGNLGGEKFCRVGNFVSGPGSNRGVDSIITLGQVSGTTLIANSANMHDYGDHSLSPGISGFPGLNHFEAVYSLSTGTNSDGSVSLYENGSLIGQATGLQFFNTPSSNAIQLWDIGGWSSTSGGTEGTVTYPITRYICAIRIASSYQGVWLMPGARTMIITGVRTLTQALTAPPLTSAVSGSTATLTWTPPTPTGQSVIAGYRVYKASAVGGPYTQLGGSLPSGQLTFADTLSATSFYQVEAFDQFTTGGRSAGAQCTPHIGGSVNWNPGFRVRAGNAAGDQSTAQNTTTFNFVHGNDVNTQRLKGIYMVYTWNQLEGAQGDYSGGEARIGPMLTLCKNAGYDYSMALNVTGNVNAGGAPAYVIGNTTYGPINLTSGTGSNGGVYQVSGSPLLVRIQNVNVAARLAAMFAHYAAYCAAQGVTLYAIWPTYSEFAFSGGQLTSGWDSDTIINGLMNPGGLADQLRTACPAQKIMFSPTFLNSGTDAARWARWQAGIKAYHICNGNYDSTNESGGVASRNYPGDTQFRGTDAAGNPLAGCSNLVGVEDSFCHQSEDSLANDPTYWNPVPRARVGDGTFPIVSQHWTQQGVSEVFFASNGYSGPVCNNFSQSFTMTDNSTTPPTVHSPPANYSTCDWDTPGTKVGNGGICGYLQKHWPNGPPQQTYLPNYP